MKKNKTVAFMLAATLMVGGTFLGTKAWFTDEAAASNDLVVTMGTLDINTNQATAEWNIVNNDNKVNSEAKKTNSTLNTFTNASTGDLFSKTITISNDGSLKQTVNVSDLTLKDSNKPAGENIQVSFSVDGKDGSVANNREFELNPNETKDIEIKVNFNPRSDANANKYNESGSYNSLKPVTFNFNELYNPITVTADQVANTQISK